MPRYELPEFTARFNALFDTSENLSREHHPTLWSIVTLKARMRTLGCDISAGQLSNLRSGKTTNPGGYHLDGLARAFGVTPMVWFSQAVFRSELERLTRERDARRGLELRS